jgi:hypothetical protein
VKELVLFFRKYENSANKLTQHIESKLNGDEKETLELDVSREEIKNVFR